MKNIKAFWRHSKITVKWIRQYERRSFYHVGRLYEGYVGLYACIKGKYRHLYVTIWLFYPTRQCKKDMKKQGRY